MNYEDVYSKRGDRNHRNGNVYEQQLNYGKKVELGFRELKCPEPGAIVCFTDTRVCRTVTSEVNQWEHCKHRVHILIVLCL